ncbi:hypothetical protein [Luteimonas abyssi]|uniref:hypothetical protein n=1 Tax=Luteimonas abyssi TaxID=1247514 RepID=UPI0012F8598A|nr:hypothetical protein [Luteimonas abyssi]
MSIEAIANVCSMRSNLGTGSAMPAVLEAFVSFGFALFSYVWPIATVFCVLGLAYLLGGHRLGTPAHDSVNRAIVHVMAAILIASVLYLVAVWYATNVDRSYGYGLFAFLLTMSLPCLLSIIGLALARFSRFPLPRG